MTNIRESITLNIVPSDDTVTPIISMQGDYGFREIEISLKQKTSTLSLAGTETVYAYFKKPDGSTIVFVSGSNDGIFTFSSGKLIIAVPLEAVNVSGLVGCNITFVTTDNKRFSTQKFYIRVREVIFSDNQLATDVKKNLLDELIENAQDACEDVADAVATLEDMRTNGYYEAHSPYLDEQNLWHEWDSVQGEYVNTNVHAEGNDGFSPTISVSKSNNVTTITITDVNGSRSVDIYDGANGTNGTNGQNGSDGSDGQDGSDGENGKSAYELYCENGGTLPLGSWLTTFASTPQYAATIDDMTDTSRIYLGANGNIYSYFSSSVPYNVLPDAFDIDESIFDDIGYRANSVLTSQGTVSSISNHPNTFVTGLLPVFNGDIFYLKNAYIDTKFIASSSLYGADTSSLLICFYDESYSLVATRHWSYSSSVRENGGAGDYDGVKCFVDDNGLCEKLEITSLDQNIAYIRFVFYSDAISTAEIYINNNGEPHFADTGITYASYELTQSDINAITEQILSELDVSYISLNNSLSVGTYTLNYDSDDTEQLGSVTI